MWKTKEALIPYLLLVAAMAGGLLWHESENIPGLGRTVTSGRSAVGGPFASSTRTASPAPAAIFPAAIS